MFSIGSILNYSMCSLQFYLSESFIQVVASRHFRAYLEEEL